MKRFIPLLLLITVFNSCSKDDDDIIQESLNQNKEVNKTLKINRYTNEELNSSVKSKDSLMMVDTPEKAENEEADEEPPVKNGNHWIIGK
ncbi:hypothetical protein [Chryseobacterium sp.]|uniref:hypothetical protein n=1 Tax=Chryseobacterium sp. TaxID=1871047 RepID=UPI0025C00F65|nr:hypothetical protein [Chryseobacterium sp.]MBV8326776.1 hypothetical protein [Chryseobacterium sp.]